MNTKSYLYLISSLIVGYVITFTIVDRYFSANADMVNSALAWNEIKEHGLSVLKVWQPTVDNWYLAIYPFHFLIFYLFGDPGVTMLKLMSVSQTVLTSLVASLIVYQVTKKRDSFLLIIFFSCLSYFAYVIGFVHHLFSHNAINLYGLLCLLIYIRWQSSIAVTILICVLSFAASVSDPWYIVAYLLPFAIFSLCVQIRRERTGFNAGIQFCMFSLTIALFFSGIIQKAMNVPVAHFELAKIDAIINNIKWYFLDYGRMVNFLFMENNVAYVISVISLISITLWLFISNASRSINFLFMLSVLGISSTFIIGNPEKAQYSARFLVNILYLAPIIIFTNLGRKHLAIVMPIFIMSILTSVWSHMSHGKNNADESTVQMIQFMRENNLNYGYGDYWGLRANDATWRSGGDVVIRPVLFDKDTGMIKWRRKHSQSFSTWYGPYKGKAFIAMTEVGETCHDIKKCFEGVQNQYGKPDDILKYKKITFFVYDRFNK